MNIRERLIGIINKVVDDAQCIGAEEIADAIINDGLIEEIMKKDVCTVKGCPNKAQTYYQDFKWKFIALLPQTSFTKVFPLRAIMYEIINERFPNLQSQ